MRIALCLSGMPRCYDKAYDYVKKNLLDQFEYNDVDVFFHTWNEVGDEKLSEISNRYLASRGKSSYQFPDKTFLKYKDHHPNWPAKNAYHMFYSLFKANEVRKEFELDNGIKYDVVIRSRFDFCLNRRLDFNSMEPGKIYVPNDYIKGHIKPNGIICNDQFAYGDGPAMDLYSLTFWNIDRAVSLGCPMIGEDLLSINLQIADLVGDKMVYIDMNHPFPPGKFNNTPHSLLREELL